MTEQFELAGEFERYFDIVPAWTSDLRNEVFRIRYLVYAEELGWESTDQFPEHREQDHFDSRSIHCLLMHRPTRTYIGCVRLVLPSIEHPNALLPAEELYFSEFGRQALQNQSNNRSQCGEISRIAVISGFRHRPGERNSAETAIEDQTQPRASERRRFPHIALGLYLAAAAIAVTNGITEVVAMMEPKLVRRLRFFGITFDQIGEPIEHRGERAAYRLTAEGFQNGLSPPLLALYNLIQSKVERTTKH